MADCTRVGTPRDIEGALHRQCVHHGGQHPDVISLRPLHAGGGAGDAAEDVAPADHQTDLHAHRGDIADIGGDGAHLIVVEAIVATRHERLARDFQQDALIGWGLRHDRASDGG